MVISELISELEQVMKEAGDLEVGMPAYYAEKGKPRKEWVLSTYPLHKVVYGMTTDRTDGTKEVQCGLLTEKMSELHS